MNYKHFSKLCQKVYIFPVNKKGHDKNDHGTALPMSKITDLRFYHPKKILHSPFPWFSIPTPPRFFSGAYHPQEGPLVKGIADSSGYPSFDGDLLSLHLGFTMVPDTNGPRSKVLESRAIRYPPGN